MKGMQIWLQAQLYNLLIGLVIAIIMLINSSEEWSVFILVCFYYFMISFIVGAPLILAFNAIELLFDKINSTNKYCYFIFPLLTHIYVLCFFMFCDESFSETINEPTVHFFALPAVLSTALAVCHDIYKTNKENIKQLNTGYQLL